MKAAVVVTGATGFLGSHLALQLLKEFPGHVVVCLARRSRDASAHDRVLRALHHAEHDTGLPCTLAQLSDRLVVVEDNLASRDLDDDVPVMAELEGLTFEAFWHCAACVKFLETEAKEVWHTNVTGLSNALALAERLRVDTFNHVSTAYACGTASGRILETIEREPERFNNAYEESKHYGEQLLHSYCETRRMQYRIIRPSIIIGHSKTFRTSSAAGFYYCIDALKLMRDKVVARDPSYFERHPLRLRVNRNATLDLIAVDFVIAEMIEVHRRGADTLNQVFHITSESPISLCDWLQKFMPLLGIRRIEFASDGEELTGLDRMFSRQMNAFLPYMTQRKVFDRSNAARYGIDRRQMDYLLDTERLSAFAHGYLAEAASAAVDQVA
jgi:nucleoside-diphosphate-sugar epimerase